MEVRRWDLWRRGLVGVGVNALVFWSCGGAAAVRAWPAVLGVWGMGGASRLRHGDQTVWTDGLLFTLANLALLRQEVVAAVFKSWVPWEWWLALASIGMFVYCARRSEHAAPKELPDGVLGWDVEYPSSRIFPCRTTHARVFPKRHAFGYSYLLYGLPIVPIGTRAGEDVSDGRDRVVGSWWLKVKADDYLERGYGELGFYGKLKKFLRERGVQDTEWSYAYLITAPRFFGYSFNPVSFWYVYDPTHELQKMILEVNNTFGERRMYLLDGACPPSPPRSSASEDSVASLPDPLKEKFTDKWLKDFHVSPFNSRKGSYALKALNPFPYPRCSVPKVDNTITLKSSKDHAKIVARVYTTSEPLDPQNMGLTGAIRFVGGWWWVGLVTFPRILKEAFKLFFARKLHVWFRPEVLSSSVGRIPSSTEVTLQTIFQDYLGYLVNQMDQGFSIDLHTAIPDHPKALVATTHRHGLAFPDNKLELRVISPGFYSRFIHYAHTSEAFDREALFTDEKNRTAWISQPELLVKVLLGRSPPREKYSMPEERSYLDELRWTFLKKIRCPPAEPAYPVTPKPTEFDVDDIRKPSFSDMDRFVRGPEGRQHAGIYRRTATKVFLAQRFALGFTEVVDLFDFLLRLFLCYVGSKKLVALVQHVSQHGCGHSTISGNSREICPSNQGNAEWWWISGAGLWVCSCHVYGLIKGYR